MRQDGEVDDVAVGGLGHVHHPTQVDARRGVVVEQGVGHAAVGPKECDRDVEHGDVEVLTPMATFAGEQRGGDRQRDLPRHGLVDQGGAHQVGERDVGVDLDRHVAAQRLQHGVEDRTIAVGPVGAVARQRHVDHVVVARSHGVVAEPQLVDLAGPHRLDDDIGALGELQHDVAARLGLHVDLDRTLAAVAVDDGTVDAALRETRHAREVADPRELDLDHLGAELGQQHRADRAGDGLRDVEDLDAVEWAGHQSSAW